MRGIKTGGRQKGSKNKATKARAEHTLGALAKGVTPLEVMLATMRAKWDEGNAEGAAAIAKDAAPYCHPKLANIEHGNLDGKPFVVAIEGIGARIL